MSNRMSGWGWHPPFRGGNGGSFSTPQMFKDRTQKTTDLVSGWMSAISP